MSQIWMTGRIGILKVRVLLSVFEIRAYLMSILNLLNRRLTHNI
jgi:hypothetical protein